MAVEIIVPKVDMVMETATFMEWLKNEGDSVKKGEPLFVIETDKAAIEIEAIESGILAGISAKPQDILPVTTVIGYILKENEPLPISKTKLEQPQPQETAPIAQSPKIKPVVQQIAQPLGEGLVRATPLARRMAKEQGLDLRQIQGRGPRGRIYRADIMETLAETPVHGSISMPMAASIQTAQQVQIPMPRAQERARIPLKSARTIIAKRVSYSATTIPHIYETITVNMDEIHRLREKLAESIAAQTSYKLTYTAIISYIVAMTLPKHPTINSSLAGEEIIQWEDVNIGLATDMDGYLIVPVVKKAQLKDLPEIVSAIGRLIDNARSRKLTPVDMMDGTFTISNLGMYGIESFTAIINPPEAAILAVGKIMEDPGSDSKQEAHWTMKITLGADHRILDGATAAKFLMDLKAQLENPYPALLINHSK